MVGRWLSGLIVLFTLSISVESHAASSQCYLPDYTVLTTGSFDRENILQNGSFEEGHALEENKWGLFDSVLGWQKSDPSGPSVEIQNGPTIGGLNPIEGSAKIELDSTANSSLKQFVPVEAGYSYHLRFNYSARQNGNPDSNGIQVLIDGVEVLNENINRKGWRTQSFFVVATSNELEIEFSGTGLSDGIGVYLDNVGLYQSNVSLELNELDNPSFEIGHGLEENKWSTYESLGAWQAGTKRSAIQFEVQKGATIGGLAPSDGLQKIELDGKKNAAILQQVASLPQTTYQLSFDYSPRTTNENTNLIELWVDNEFIATISNNQKGFVRYDFDILARYESLRIEFRGAGTSDGLGAYLDNVVLNLEGGSNLLVNGSFEDDLGLDDNKWRLYQNIPGWTASIEEDVIVPFEIQNGETVGGFFAGDQNAKLEMDAHENSAVFQDLNLDQDRMYLLSLLYTPRINDDLETNKVGVYFEDQKIGELNGTQKGWKPFEFLVKPEFSSSRLEFRAEGTSDSLGGYIDQVSLNQISNCELNQAPVGQIITNVFNPERPFDVNHFFEGYDPDGYVVSVDWILADLTSATGNFIPYQYDLAAGTYPVIMTVTDDLGAQTTITKDIELGRPVPQVIVTASAYEGVAPFDVDLDASSSFSDNGAIVAYEWVDTVGDLVAETPELYLTLEEPGDYFYTVFVRDELGYVGVYGVTINVFEENQNQRPIAAIQTNIYDPTQPFNVDHFSNASDPDGIIVSEEWVLLDGTTASGTSVNRLYDLAPGTYNLTLTVTDNLGATDSVTVPVTLGLPLPTPVVTVDQQSGTAPLTVTFDASGSFSDNGPIVSFEWEVGDDEFYNPESFDAVFTRTFEEPGSYPVYLGIADSEGVYNFYSTTIDVYPSSANIPPVADFNFNIYNPERPFSVGHFSQSYDPDGFVVSEEWILADGSVAYGSVVDMNYDLEPGIYDVTLRVTDGEGAQSEITKQIELGLPLPVPVVTIDQLSGEAPLTVTFDASSSFSDNGQIVGYSWEVGDDGIFNPESFDPVFTRTFTEPGNYPVYLAINDEKGVFAFYSVNIEVTERDYQLPAISIFNSKGVAPLPIEITYSNELLDGVSIQWDLGDGTIVNGLVYEHTYIEPIQTQATISFFANGELIESRSFEIESQELVEENIKLAILDSDQSRRYLLEFTETNLVPFEDTKAFIEVDLTESDIQEGKVLITNNLSGESFQNNRIAIDLINQVPYSYNVQVFSGQNLIVDKNFSIQNLYNNCSEYSKDCLAFANGERNIINPGASEVKIISPDGFIFDTNPNENYLFNVRVGGSDITDSVQLLSDGVIIPTSLIPEGSRIEVFSYGDQGTIDGFIDNVRFSDSSLLISHASEIKKIELYDLETSFFKVVEPNSNSYSIADVPKGDYSIRILTESEIIDKQVSIEGITDFNSVSGTSFLSQAIQPQTIVQSKVASFDTTPENDSGPLSFITKPNCTIFEFCDSPELLVAAANTSFSDVYGTRDEEYKISENNFRNVVLQNNDDIDAIDLRCEYYHTAGLEKNVPSLIDPAKYAQYLQLLEIRDNADARWREAANTSTILNQNIDLVHDARQRCLETAPVSQTCYDEYAPQIIAASNAWASYVNGPYTQAGLDLQSAQEAVDNLDYSSEVARNGGATIYFDHLPQAFGAFGSIVASNSPNIHKSIPVDYKVYLDVYDVEEGTGRLKLNPGASKLVKTISYNEMVGKIGPTDVAGKTSLTIEDLNPEYYASTNFTVNLPKDKLLKRSYRIRLAPVDSPFFTQLKKETFGNYSRVARFSKVQCHLGEGVSDIRVVKIEPRMDPTEGPWTVDYKKWNEPLKKYIAQPALTTSDEPRALEVLDLSYDYFSSKNAVESLKENYGYLPIGSEEIRGVYQSLYTLDGEIDLGASYRVDLELPSNYLGVGSLVGLRVYANEISDDKILFQTEELSFVSPNFLAIDVLIDYSLLAQVIGLTTTAFSVDNPESVELIFVPYAENLSGEPEIIHNGELRKNFKLMYELKQMFNLVNSAEDNRLYGGSITMYGQKKMSSFINAMESNLEDYTYLTIDPEHDYTRQFFSFDLDDEKNANSIRPLYNDVSEPFGTKYEFHVTHKHGLDLDLRYFGNPTVKPIRWDQSLSSIEEGENSVFYNSRFTSDRFSGGIGRGRLEDIVTFLHMYFRLKNENLGCNKVGNLIQEIDGLNVIYTQTDCDDGLNGGIPVKPFNVCVRNPQHSVCFGETNEGLAYKNAIDRLATWVYFQRRFLQMINGHSRDAGIVIREVLISSAQDKKSIDFIKTRLIELGVDFVEISNFFSENIDRNFGIFGQMIVDGKWITGNEIFLEGVNLNSYIYSDFQVRFTDLDFIRWERTKTTHMNHYNISINE